MDGFCSTCLEQSTDSGRNEGIILKQLKWSHFLKQKKKKKKKKKQKKNKYQS